MLHQTLQLCTLSALVRGGQIGRAVGSTALASMCTCSAVGCSDTSPRHPSAGIVSHYRRKGLGTMLVTSLLEYVARFHSTKVVYLHVLADNAPAIGELSPIKGSS